MDAIEMDAIETALEGGNVSLELETRPELAALRDCPQSVVFHGEGDVARHSILVYDLAREHVDRLADETKADPDGRGGSPEQAVVLRLAGLLHDLGKPATTVRSGPGRWSAHGHDLEGARLVSLLFASHPALQELPLGVYVSVHAMVRAHMWTYAGEQISAGAALRLSHATDPRLLMALWDSDSRGRICDDGAELADRVAFAGRVLQDFDAVRPDSYGLMDRVASRTSVSPRAWRETFRALVDDELPDPDAVAARIAAAERLSTRGSITYTMGLPGLGKSSWAREVWAPATDGIVLETETETETETATRTRTKTSISRRHDRPAAATTIGKIAELLAAGRQVCVVGTHLGRENRDGLVTLAGRYGADLHAAYFNAPLPRELRWPTPDEYQTLRVIEPSGKTWHYNPESRWRSQPTTAEKIGGVGDQGG